MYNERTSLFPQTDAEFDKLVEHNKAFAASCVEKSGKLTYHMDTASVAKDFEAVRKATGSEKFNYLGFSYGTFIGYQYAQLFPDKIGSMVLDAVANHADSETSMLVTETETYEDEFVRFAEWASKSNESVLAGQDVAALFDSLVQKADESPLALGSTPGSRANITGEGFCSASRARWSPKLLDSAQAGRHSAKALRWPLAAMPQRWRRWRLWLLPEMLRKTPASSLALQSDAWTGRTRPVTSPP